jgi:hypothetical protein
VSEEAVVLAGYSPAKRVYFLQGFIACILVSVIALLWFKYLDPIPLLFVTASCLGELWWRNKNQLQLVGDGLKYGTAPIPWEQITRYTTWGPIGIPWTPLKFHGITVYLKNGLQFSVYSTAKGFAVLLPKLEGKQFPPLPEAIWYTYPARPIRTLRYVIAFTFALVYMVALAVAKFLLIVALVAAGYFLYRAVVKLYRIYRQKGTLTPERIWFTVMGCIVGGGILCLLIFWLGKKIPVLSSIILFIVSVVSWIVGFVTSLLGWLPFLVGFIPVVLFLWYPWHPASLAILHEAVFAGKNTGKKTGKNNAYPLRHLRSERMMSKFFVFKIWELVFANGGVTIFPLLEDFESFKKKLLSQWDEVQKRYYGKPFTEEEAKIRKPAEEAKYILAAKEAHG